MASTMALTECTALSWMAARHDARSRAHLSRANCMRKSGGGSSLVSETGTRQRSRDELFSVVDLPVPENVQRQ